MIPGEIHQEPGKDSMGMDLVPVYADEAAAGAIRIDPVVEQNMGVRVDKVIRGPLAKTVRTVGFVDYDETTLGDGDHQGRRLDREALRRPDRRPGAPGRAAVRPLLAGAVLGARGIPGGAAQPADDGGAERSASRATTREALVRDARTRLEYFDISPEQIAQLKRSGKVQKTLTIRAPFTGIVTQKNVVEGQKVRRRHGRLQARRPVHRLGDGQGVRVRPALRAARAGGVS